MEEQLDTNIYSLFSKRGNADEAKLACKLTYLENPILDNFITATTGVADRVDDYFTKAEDFNQDKNGLGNNNAGIQGYTLAYGAQDFSNQMFL